MVIKFDVNRDDREAISKIVDRAAERFESIDRLSLEMDITATHANGNPLDLAGLLDAEPFDFAHDIAGIVRHLDRTTGALTDCFVPRYADRRAEAVQS